MTSHCDADVLADYREGLLDQRRSARIRAHLAECPQCSALDAGLAEVTELLASTPTPPMPEHLVTRLENALAIEAAARAGTAADGPATRSQVTGGQITDGQITDGQITDGQITPGQGAGTAGRAADGTTGRSDQTGTGADTGTDGRWPPRRRERAGSGRRWEWRTAWLGAAAVLVLILAVGGVYGLARALHQSASTSSASSGGAAGPAGLAGPADASPEISGGPRSSKLGPMRSALPAASLHAIASGTDYRAGTLTSQVRSVLTRQRSANSAKSPPAYPATQAGSAQLRGCVTLITGGKVPNLVDVAHYQGQPATIIVQAAASGQPAQVWVAGPGCSATSRDVIAHTELTGGS